MSVYRFFILPGVFGWPCGVSESKVIFCSCWKMLIELLDHICSYYHTAKDLVVTVQNSKSMEKTKLSWKRKENKADELTNRDRQNVFCSSVGAKCKTKITCTSLCEKSTQKSINLTKISIAWPQMSL